MALPDPRAIAHLETLRVSKFIHLPFSLTFNLA